MKIGLLGFTFAHENMGCQALTYSFLGMLTEMFPNEKIDIVDFHEEKSLGLVPERFPQLNIEIYRISLKKDFKGFLKKLNECFAFFAVSCVAIAFVTVYKFCVNYIVKRFIRKDAATDR